MDKNRCFDCARVMTDQDPVRLRSLDGYPVCEFCIEQRERLAAIKEEARG